MSNAPDRFEAILLEPDEKKVTVESETRVPNAAIFHLAKEDHTLGNIIRDKLLRDPATTFSAYKVPHPLFPFVDIRVQTDGSIDPTEAMIKACRGLIGDLNMVSQEFTKEWELNKIARAAEGEEGLNSVEQQNGQQNVQQNGQNGQYGYGYGAPQGQYQAQGYPNGAVQNPAQGYQNGASGGQGYSYGYANGSNGAGY